MKRVVVFGTDRIASIWALRNGVPRETAMLATHPEEFAQLVGPITVVRVSKDVWKPSTFPDEVRVKATEVHLIEYKQVHEVKEELLE